MGITYSSGGYFAFAFQDNMRGWVEGTFLERISRAIEDAVSDLARHFDSSAQDVGLDGNAPRWIADFCLLGLLSQALYLIKDVLLLVRAFTVDSAREHRYWAKARSVRLGWDGKYTSFWSGAQTSAYPLCRCEST